MTVERLLSGISRALARARARRLAFEVALLGALGAALLLFLDRAGYGPRLPWSLPDPSAAERLFGYLLISVQGLVQGARMLAVVALAALAVRLGAPLLLRQSPAAVARHLDAALQTDRHAAALEARGPFAALVARAVVESPPAVPVRAPRARKPLILLAVLLVLAVALLPGVAGGTSGPAPVPGDPSAGEQALPLRLALVGERAAYPPGVPVPVQVVLESLAPPVGEIDLPVTIAIDGGEGQATGRRLFLAAGAPGIDFAALDLRAFLAQAEPGDHEAVARAGALASNVYRFRIEPPDTPGDPPPSPPEPPENPGGGGASPPQVRRPEFVEPLVREGEMVEKLAKVPIEVPGGGAPQERTLQEAWPELQRRREAALNRPGLSPAARELVRRYFEQLERRVR